MPAAEFRSFVLHCYGATRHVDAQGKSHIHGRRNKTPIWVGAPDQRARANYNDVLAFANAVRRTSEYQQSNLRDATMLAWGFDDSARNAADRLRQQEQLDLNFVHIDQVRIDQPKFRQHIASQSTDRGDYTDFLTFIQPPAVEIGVKALGGHAFTFDAGDTGIMNADAQIVNVQWDFNYDGLSFKATPGFSFVRDKKKPKLTATMKFPRAGKFRVACKVQDSMGGEGLDFLEVEVA